MLQLRSATTGGIILDNIENNGINNTDNGIPADISEVTEVKALPEDEAMMAYCEVSSDMPSISAAPQGQPVLVSAPEPSQMDSISPVKTVSDNTANTVGAFAPIGEAAAVTSMPGISAQSDFTPDNNGGIADDSNEQPPQEDLHNLQEDGAFLAARKSTKNKKAPVVADAFSMYPDAPTLQKSTGRPLTADEARKYYATHKPVEKKPEEEQVQEVPEDTSKENPKIIIYFAILAICVIALVGCIIGLLTFKPKENHNGGTSNGSSSVSGNVDASNGSSNEETDATNESSVPSSNEQSASEKPTESGQSSSSASSTTTTKTQSGQATQTTRHNNQTLPSSVTTKTPSSSPASSVPVSSDKPSSSISSSSTAPVITVRPQSSTSQSSTTPHSSTTTQTTTVKPQITTTTTTTTTTKKPQPDPPTPVSPLYSVKFIANSEWPQDGNKAQSATFRVRNNSGTDMGDWTLVLKIDGLVSINCWSADCAISGNTLTIKKIYQFYESGLLNDGTYDVDCNIVTKNGVKIKSATLNGSPVEIIG